MTTLEYKKKLNKVMSEHDAVAKFLKEGDTFTVGGFLLNRESDSVFSRDCQTGAQTPEVYRREFNPDD